MGHYKYSLKRDIGAWLGELLASLDSRKESHKKELDEQAEQKLLVVFLYSWRSM